VALIVRRLAQLGGTTTRGDAARAVALAARRTALVDGPALIRYEEEVARWAGAAHAISFAAGRIGLFGILRGLGVGPGHEVIVPVPTHIVVTNAVRYTGATPVYVDCRLTDFNVDPEQVAAAIGPRTRAVLVQHTFGIPADMEALLGMTGERDVPLVEDCVHALGATWRGRPVGGIGVAGFFSTEETKIISTTMGGAAVTGDDELAEHLRRFQRECPPPGRSLTRRRLAKLALYHVLTEPHVHTVTRPAYELFGGRNPLPVPTSPEELAGERPPEYEQRLAAGQADIGLRQLARLDGNLAHRRAIAAEYAAALGPHGFAPPVVADDAEPAWVRYPVRVADRDAAIRVLRRHVVPGTWFTSVQEEAVRPTINGYAAGSCPRAETAARELINLPTHQRVTPDDARALAKVVARLEPAR
jgi:dTDP-4-amino-4,6-dideoxygalactose transaminase